MSSREEITIPLLTSFLNLETFSADSDKVAQSEVGKRKSLHKASQKLLDPLRDVAYWDHQVSLNQCDKEMIDLSAERAERKPIETEGSIEDFREVKRSTAQQRSEKEVEREDILAQREKLSSYEDHPSGIMKSLHDAKEAFLLVLNKACNDRFRPGPRSSTMQTAFRRTLIQDHRAKEPGEKGSNLWCPIVGQYLESRYVIAAHIFPYRMGEDVMTSVFGEGLANEMFSARNGLLLHEFVEHTFDKFLIAIVPAAENDPKAWKLRVMDNSIINQNIPGKI